MPHLQPSCAPPSTGPRRRLLVWVILLASWIEPAVAAEIPVPAAAAAADTARSATTPPTVARIGLLRSDRLQHASLSFAIGLGAGIATDEPAAAALPIALGLGKEWLDRRQGGRFDWIDLAAGGIGAGLAALVLLGVAR